ncbi:MAG: glycosyl hydrolase [Mycobacteriales bacterium]
MTTDTRGVPTMRARGLNTMRAGVVSVLAALSTLLAAAPPASAATLPAPISSTMFGLHVSDPYSNWPQVPFSTIRLHDTGTSWREMQPAPGVWNWGTLDHRVERAVSGRREVLMVLGQTPRWAAKRPNETSYNGPGAASEPADMATWRAYVRSLAIRYKGQIHKWELWNEPNVKGFYSGTPATMLTMAREAYTVLKRIDPANVVVSPGIAVRTLNSPTWLDRYLAAGGARYSDVIAVHLYVMSRQRPESILGSVSRIRQIMAKHKVNRPIWNTESGYGRTAGTPETSELYTGQMAMAFVARTYILTAHARVDRTYWYAWDDRGFGGLFLTSEDRNTPSDAGRAYGVTYQWLVRARLLRCSRVAIGPRAGTYACLLTRGRERMEISWHPTMSYLAPVPAGYRSVSRLDGSKVSAKPGTLIRISPMPIMVSTAG